MTGHIIERSAFRDGELVMISVLDDTGTRMLAFPGQIALDLLMVDMPPGRTLLLAETYPLALLDAAIGLPARDVIGHPYFASDSCKGQAMIRATCVRGDFTFIAFDRNVLPRQPADRHVVCRRISVEHDDAARLAFAV